MKDWERKTLKYQRLIISKNKDAKDLGCQKLKISMIEDIKRLRISNIEDINLTKIEEIKDWGWRWLRILKIKNIKDRG